MDNKVDVTALHAFAGHMVRVRLTDGREYVGSLRTDLLTDLSLAVYLDADEGEGATLYIDHITGIWPAR